MDPANPIFDKGYKRPPRPSKFKDLPKMTLPIPTDFFEGLPQLELSEIKGKRGLKLSKKQHMELKVARLSAQKKDLDSRLNDAKVNLQKEKKGVKKTDKVEVNAREYEDLKQQLALYRQQGIQKVFTSKSNSPKKVGAGKPRVADEEMKSPRKD